MTKFEVINSVNEINLGCEWKDSINFKNNGKIVDIKGKKVSVSYSGQSYRLIAKKERNFSGLERLERGFLGTLIIVCSLGIALFSKKVRSLFTKNHESIRFGIPTRLDPLILLPEEVNIIIFSYLNSTELGRCLAVSKAWRALASDDTLWSALAFGKKAWITYFGNIGEEPPLPKYIHNILKSPCPFQPGKKIKDTHMLFLIPETINGKPLTLNTLGELVKCPKAGYATRYRCKEIENEDENKPTPNSHWALMTTDVLPDSRNKSYAEQKALITQVAGKAKIAYEIPNLLDAVVCLFLKYVVSKERLFRDKPATFTRCQGDVLDFQTIVGNFSLKGLEVFNNEHDDNSNDLGIAAIVKF